MGTDKGEDFIQQVKTEDFDKIHTLRRSLRLVWRTDKKDTGKSKETTAYEEQKAKHEIQCRVRLELRL